MNLVTKDTPVILGIWGAGLGQPGLAALGHTAEL